MEPQMCVYVRIAGRHLFKELLLDLCRRGNQRHFSSVETGVMTLGGKSSFSSLSLSLSRLLFLCTHDFPYFSTLTFVRGKNT